MQALVSASVDPEVVAALEQEFDWRSTYVSSVASGLAELDADARGSVQAVVVEADPIGASAIEALTGLEVIACLRSDPVNVDVAAATQHGIPVLYTPGRNAESVADFTLGLCIASLRSIAISHQRITDGQLVGAPAAGSGAGQKPIREDVIWRPADRDSDIPYVLYQGRELSGLAIGIIGFGAVGRSVARRFSGLVRTVMVVDPHVDPTELRASGHEPLTLEQMLARADVVTLHARSSSVIIGEAQLALMKMGSYLINTARATVLDYDALGAAITSGRLKGAALDVFPEEPIPSDSPLLALPGITLTPHIAGAAAEVVTRQSQIFLDGIIGLYRGDSSWSKLPVKNPEVEQMWRRRRSAGSPPDDGSPSYYNESGAKR
jgi:D-3-phosphoglycerate dehydrogenase